MITVKEKGKKGKNCHTSKEKRKTAEENYQRTSKAEIKREREKMRGTTRTKLSKIHNKTKQVNTNRKISTRTTGMNK